MKTVNLCVSLLVILFTFSCTEDGVRHDPIMPESVENEPALEQLVETPRACDLDAEAAKQALEKYQKAGGNHKQVLDFLKNPSADKNLRRKAKLSCQVVHIKFDLLNVCLEAVEMVAKCKQPEHGFNFRSNHEQEKMKIAMSGAPPVVGGHCGNFRDPWHFSGVTVQHNYGYRSSHEQKKLYDALNDTSVVGGFRGDHDPWHYTASDSY